ncbi:MAG TPA: class I SAM-dependent methyltransferase [Vicinamibacterales bacterium]|nr:class I SAM-dependent methyltransferase [Vicinamibacterales bacterium]
MPESDRVTRAGTAQNSQLVSGYRCCLCKSDQAIALSAETDIARIGPLRRIVGCRRCGLRSVWPIPSPEDLALLYTPLTEQQYVSAGLGYIGGIDTPPERLKLRLERLERRTRAPRSLLDVGVGSGAFISEAIRRGWHAIGTEFSESTANAVRRRYSVEVWVGELPDLDLPRESFDVVHMNHVLEHVRDPVRTLRAAGQLLKPLGILVIEVPQEFRDLAFVVRRLFGKPSFYLMPSQHLWFFEPTTIRNVTEGAGLVVERIETFRAGKGVVRRVVGLMEKSLGRGPLIELWAHRR